MPSHQLRHAQASGRKRTAFVLQSIALLSLLVFSSVLAAPLAYAFANGQNASVVIGQPDFNTKTTGTPVTNASRLSSPDDVKFDSSGNLWVADSANSRILEFKPPFTNNEKASLVLGESSFTTSYLAGYTPVNGSVIADPLGMTFDSSGNLWVSDTGDSRILEFTAPFSSGENASLVLGVPTVRTPGDNTQSASQTNLNNPAGLTFDSSGNLWVADPGYYRVVEFKAPFTNGEAASTVLGQDNFTAKNFPNEPDCPPNCGSPTAATLNGPYDVAFDHSGNLWVASRDDHRMVEFVPPFTNGMAGSVFIAGSCSIFGQLLGANCSSVIEYFAFDSSGMLWVSDTGNGRVMGFPAPFTTGENATVVLGEPDFQTTYGVVVNATQSNLVSPEGIAFDSSGNLWVGDSAFNRVLEFSASAVTTTTSTTTANTTPTTMTSVTTTSTQQTTTGQPPTTSSTTQTAGSSTSSSSGGGGIPEFPYQGAAVAAITVLVAASYLLLRRGRVGEKGAVRGGSTFG